MEQSELPVGFAMALAQNPQAMQTFARLSEAEKQQVIAGTHGVRSREEMHQYVERLAERDGPMSKHTP